MPQEQNRTGIHLDFTEELQNNIKNALIVGLAGSGKSTLANALTDTNQFRESNFSVGATRSFQIGDIFQWEGKSYRVVDNIGFSDTSISEEEILYEIGEGIYSAKEGINQIFFVFDGRFSEEQVRAFTSFKKFISESRITRFTTVIRTRFPNFRNPQKCEEDRKKLLAENQELKEIINSCKDFIHVDNAPIPVVEAEDSDGEKKNKERQIVRNKEKRKDSRERVLKHLAENCPEIYKLEGWDNIYCLVVNYIKKIEELEKSDNPRRMEEIKKIKTEAAKEIKVNLEAKLTNELIAAVEQNIQR